MPSTDLSSTSQHALFNVPEHDLTLSLEPTSFKRPANRQRSKSDPYMVSPVTFEPAPGFPAWAFAGNNNSSSDFKNPQHFIAAPLPVAGIDPRALDGGSPSLTPAQIPSAEKMGADDFSIHANSFNGEGIGSGAGTEAQVPEGEVFGSGKHSQTGPSPAVRRRSAVGLAPYDAYGTGSSVRQAAPPATSNQGFLVPPSPLRRPRSHSGGTSGHRRAAQSEDFTASTYTPRVGQFEGLEHNLPAPMQYSGYQPNFPPMPESHHHYNLPPLPTPLESAPTPQYHAQQQLFEQQRPFEHQQYGMPVNTYTIPPMPHPSVMPGYTGYVSNAGFDNSYPPPMIYAPLEEDHTLTFDPMTMINRPRRRSSIRSDVSGWSGAASDVTFESKTTEATKQAARRRRKDPYGAKFECEYCQETFTRAYNLKGHIRSHEGSKPFDCKECGKGFARRHDLKRHENLHSGIKKFICEACQTPFVRLDALQRHHKSEVSLCTRFFFLKVPQLNVQIAEWSSLCCSDSRNGRSSRNEL